MGFCSVWSMLLFTALSQITVNVFIRCRKTEKPKIPRRREIQRKPGKVSCKRAETTTQPGKWQVDVTAAEIQRERVSCRTAEKLEYSA